MKKLSVMLCAILLLAAMVLPVSAGSMDSVWQDLKLEEYHLFAKGDLAAYHMRGFDVTEDGKYILGGVLNAKGTSALEKIDFGTVASAGYSFQLEMNHRAWKAGLLTREIPIAFTDRAAGYSKITAGIAKESLKIAWRLRRFLVYYRA